MNSCHLVISSGGLDIYLKVRSGPSDTIQKIRDIKVKYSLSKTVSSMEKPSIMAVILAGSLLMVPSIAQFASAQYGGAGDTTPGSIEEQLELAKEKISNAQQSGAYGSGTPMLGTNISETVLFIGILVAIFGAVAGMFFYRSRTAKKATA